MSLPYDLFPFNGHLSLSMHAKFHLALAAPSQGREGVCPSVALLLVMLRGSRQDAAPAYRGSTQTDPAQPSTSPEASLRSFPNSTHSAMDAEFIPAPISSHSASVQQMLMSCICSEKEIMGKQGTLERRGFDLFSLISSLNSPYQYFSLSAKVL